MGKRQRKRARSGDTPASSAATTYPFGADGSLTLRDELTGGTLRTLEKLDAQPAASADDRWQRRIELLFERLVVSWEIAGLPLDSSARAAGPLPDGVGRRAQARARGARRAPALALSQTWTI